VWIQQLKTIMQYARHLRVVTWLSSSNCCRTSVSIQLLVTIMQYDWHFRLGTWLSSSDCCRTSVSIEQLVNIMQYAKHKQKRLTTAPSVYLYVPPIALTRSTVMNGQDSKYWTNR
jgi:hypothetical protein